MSHRPVSVDGTKVPRPRTHRVRSEAFRPELTARAWRFARSVYEGQRTKSGGEQNWRYVGAKIPLTIRPAKGKTQRQLDREANL